MTARRNLVDDRAAMDLGVMGRVRKMSAAPTDAIYYMFGAQSYCGWDYGDRR